MLHLVSLRNQSTVLSLPQLYRSCSENPSLDVDPGRSESAMQRSNLEIPREILSEPTKPPTPFAVSKFTVIEEPVAYPRSKVRSCRGLSISAKVLPKGLRYVSPRVAICYRGFMSKAI